MIADASEGERRPRIGCVRAPAGCRLDCPWVRFSTAILAAEPGLCERLRVSHGVADARLAEGPQAQRARVARPARERLGAVARPRQFERRAEFQPPPDDLRLAQAYDGRPDPDAGLGACAHVNGALEGFVELGAAVGVAGRVLGDRADVDARRPDDLGPTRRGAEQVRVAEGDVAGRNLARGEVCFRDGYRAVRQRRAADAREVFERDDEAARDPVEVGQLLERAPLARLRALPVGDVEECQLLVLLARDRRRYARVHPARDEADGERPDLIILIKGRLVRLVFVDELLVARRAAHQTPCTSGPQMYLCSCNCILTFLKPLCETRSASSLKSVSPHTGEIRTARARLSSPCSSTTRRANSQSARSCTTNLTSSRSARSRARFGQWLRSASPDAG